jgi:hypothetical protein
MADGLKINLVVLDARSLFGIMTNLWIGIRHGTFQLIFSLWLVVNLG